MKRSHLQTSRPRLETLEDRQLLSTCNVTRLSDTGAGKGFRGDLRYCMTKANADPGEDLIIFQSTAHGTINLTSALPTIADDLIIAGPGADIVTVRRQSGGNYRIFDNEAYAQIYSITIANGSSFMGGGGVSNRVSLTLGSVAIVDNLTTSSVSPALGGGVYNTGTLNVYDSTIARNLALQTNIGVSRGGGIANLGTGIANVFNSTIAFNRAEGDNGQSGGGVYNSQNSSITIVSSTISQNDSMGNGDGIFGDVELMWHTIVAGNGASGASDLEGNILSGGFNLIGGDPKLGPLAFNGGHTDTMALLPGSPAIDAGDNTDAPEWDQRGPGFPRIVNGTIDIGAFEVQATPTPTPTPNRTGLDLLAVVLATADLETFT